MTYNSLNDERESLQTTIRELKKQIAVLPPGKLMVYKNGQHVRWYVQYDQGKRGYLSKESEELAKQLAMKVYLTARLEDEQRNLKGIEMLMKIHGFKNGEKTSSEAQKVLSNPLIKPLLMNQILELSQYTEYWLSRPYPSMAPFQEERRIRAVNGLMVRSKSEAGIVSVLLNRNIPFLYEYPLDLSGSVIYPDFTLLDIHDNSESFLEHLGMMDNPRYARDAAKKIAAYGLKGIIPSRNLILTFETDSQPLNFAYLDTLLQFHFGS